MGAEAARREAVGQMADGTVYFAPIGEVVRDAAGRVLCHLCGRWFQAIAPAHLAKARGWTAGEYRDAFGLNRSTPLRSLRLVRNQRRVMRRLLATDQRVAQALVEAREAAGAGRRAADLELGHRGSQRLERRLRSRESAGRASRIQSRAAVAARRRRVRHLGFSSERAFLHARYVKEGQSVLAVATELQVTQSTVRKLLEDNQFPVLAGPLSAAQSRRLTQLRLLTSEIRPGAGETWESWLRRSTEEGVSQTELAAMSGRSRAWVRHSLVLLGPIADVRA